MAYFELYILASLSKRLHFKTTGYNRENTGLLLDFQFDNYISGNQDTPTYDALR